MLEQLIVPLVIGLVSGLAIVSIFGILQERDYAARANAPICKFCYVRLEQPASKERGFCVSCYTSLPTEMLYTREEEMSLALTTLGDEYFA